MRDVEVVLYGATGYTGRLIAQELDALGASFVVAGRDRAKLESLSSSLASRPPVAVAALDDAAALDAAVSRGRVVLSAAGPFVDAGPPVLAAALRTRTHFADITGEQAFLLHALSRDAEARQAGVAVVDALGFDVVPSDLAASLAADGLGPLRALDIAILSSGGLSGGTRRSMARSAGAGGWWERGALRSAPPGRLARRFAFPEGEKEGVFVPWGDCVTAPRSTGAPTVRTFFVLPPRVSARLRRAWPVLAMFPRLAARGAPRGSGDGPGPVERATATFTVLAEATAVDGRTQVAIVRGVDPYGLTGATAARLARVMASPSFGRTGVLTPTQAFERATILSALSGFVGEARLRSSASSVAVP